MKEICGEQVIFLNSSAASPVIYHRTTILFVLEAGYLFTVMVVATVTNILVMVAILRIPMLRRNMNNILVLNLIIMDLCTTLGSMPFAFADLFSTGYFLCYELLCRVHGFFALLGCFGNFSAIVLISIYRCINIVTGNKVNIKKKHIAIMIMIGWLCACLITWPPVSGQTSSPVYTPGTHHCTPAWGDSCAFYTICIAIMYIVTVPTLIICYALIHCEVTRSADRVGRYMNDSYRVADDCPFNQSNSERRKEIHDGYHDETDMTSHNKPTEGDLLHRHHHHLHHHVPRSIPTISETMETHDVTNRGPGRSKIKRIKRTDRKVAITAMLLILTTTVCWTPYFIVHSCRLNIDPTHAQQVFAMWVAYTNAALDPIIYTALNIKIRRAVLQQIHLPLKCYL